MTPSKFDPTSLGNMALILEDVPTEQLKRAVEYQRKAPGQKLGEIFVRLGVLPEDAVRRLLQKQREFRDGKVSDGDMQRLVDFAVDSTVQHGQKIAEAMRRKKR